MHSDNSVYAQLTSIVGPQNVAKMARDAGIQSKLNSYFAIGLGAEAANPLEMARAYSTFANGEQRQPDDGSILGNEPRAITQIRKNKKVVYARGAQPDEDGDPELDPAEGRDRGHRHAAALRTAPSPARPGRPRTTATPGSSGTCRSSYAVWVGYPRELRPMVTEFHGGPSPAERSRPRSGTRSCNRR